jgi:hypothetical protein
LHLKVCLDGREHIGSPPSELKNNSLGFDVRTIEYQIKPIINPITKLINIPTIVVHPCNTLLIALIPKNAPIILNRITL